MFKPCLWQSLEYHCEACSCKFVPLLKEEAIQLLRAVLGILLCINALLLLSHRFPQFPLNSLKLRYNLYIYAMSQECWEAMYLYILSSQFWNPSMTWYFHWVKHAQMDTKWKILQCPSLKSFQHTSSVTRRNITESFKPRLLHYSSWILNHRYFGIHYPCQPYLDTRMTFVQWIGEPSVSPEMTKETNPRSSHSK